MDNPDFELIDVADAQERLEELVDLLLSGEARGFIICRNGKPSVQLLPMA